jgi:hypothetical protein
MHPVSQHGAGSGIAGRGAQTRVAGRRQSVLPPVGRCLRPRIKAIDPAVEAGQIAIDIGIIVHRRIATAEQLSGDYRVCTVVPSSKVIVVFLRSNGEIFCIISSGLSLINANGMISSPRRFEVNIITL